MNFKAGKVFQIEDNEHEIWDCIITVDDVVIMWAENDEYSHTMINMSLDNFNKDIGNRYFKFIEYKVIQVGK